jgi:hypothetical protein
MSDKLPLPLPGSAAIRGDIMHSATASASASASRLSPAQKRTCPSSPERERAKAPSSVKVKEVRVEGRRYVVRLNEEQRRKDAAARVAIAAALREQLAKGGGRSLIGSWRTC